MPKITVELSSGRTKQLFFSSDEEMGAFLRKMAMESGDSIQRPMPPEDAIVEDSGLLPLLGFVAAAVGVAAIFTIGMIVDGSMSSARAPRKFTPKDLLG